MTDPITTSAGVTPHLGNIKSTPTSTAAFHTSTMDPVTSSTPLPTTTSGLSTSPGSSASNSKLSKGAVAGIATTAALLHLPLVAIAITMCWLVIRKAGQKQAVQINLQLSNPMNTTSNTAGVTSPHQHNIYTTKTEDDLHYSDTSVDKCHIPTEGKTDTQTANTHTRNNTCITRNVAYIQSLTISFDEGDSDNDLEYDYVHLGTKYRPKRKGKENLTTKDERELSASYVIPNLNS